MRPSEIATLVIAITLTALGLFLLWNHFGSGWGAAIAGPMMLWFNGANYELRRHNESSRKYLEFLESIERKLP